jgi:ribosomal protein S18 acetylase RimI-like enzyme
MPTIRKYDPSKDHNGVVDLWRAVFGYETAHNDPSLAISKKVAIKDDLFFVAADEASIIGTAMAGYDGHRGWLYAVAVHTNHRHSGLGSKLVYFAEEALIAVGCMKINLQLLASNESTAAFYTSLGYAVERRISMGKILHVGVAGHFQR